MILSVGCEKECPKAERHDWGDVSEFVSLLMDHDIPRAWWSAHAFDGDYRSQERWQSSCAVAIDCDFYDAAGKHAAPPDELRPVLARAALDLGATLFHETPRGGRAVWLLAQQCADAELWQRAATAVCERLDALLQGTGFRVDRGASCDRARFLWSPTTIVDDVQRQAEVLTMGDPVAIEDLLADPRDQQQRDDRRNGEPSLQDAVDRYRREHRLEVPRSNGTCPLCQHNKCFGAMPTDPARWYCWSDAHGQDSGVGVQGSRGWHGDVLDLHAAQAGVTRFEFLRQRGYLDQSSNGYDDLLRNYKRATGAAGAAPSSSQSPPAERPWPAPVAVEARRGLAGQFLELVEPETEADPHALLVQFLVYFGACIGRSPYVMVGAVRHGTNLFAVVAGATSRGRKGTSEAEVRRLFRIADDQWTNKNIVSGLSSGEGVIAAIRDDAEGPPDKRTGEPTTIPGVHDKRLLAVEGEFARVLAQVARDGNVLSAILRDAWDGLSLRSLVKNSPTRATDPHISVLAHCTQFELLARMSETDLFNGTGNRFLFACSQRTKKLPFGGNVDPARIEALAHQVKAALQHARRQAIVGFTPAATEFWTATYDAVSVDRPGLWGALTARAEAQVIRLALVYAMLDCAAAIDAEHLRAALAVWNYCDASVAHLFGDKLGNPVADRLLAAIRAAGTAGISRTKLSAALGRNVDAAKIDAGLQLLLAARMVRMAVVGEGKAAAETWFPA